MLDRPTQTSFAANSRAAQVAAWLRVIERRIRRPVHGSYAAEIDGLRFVAIAIVVIGHFMERAVRFFPSAESHLVGNSYGELLLHPGLGVYLFFAISGFVIARQVFKADADPLSARFLKAYFGRRVLRIEPPYIILLACTLLVLTIGGYRPDGTHHFDAVPASLGVSFLGSIFYVHDLVWGTFPRLFPPGWSLEIEVQFYVLAPLLFWAFLKARSSFARTALATVGLVGGAFLSLVAPPRIGPAHAEMSILLFFHFFWLGILLAHLHGWIVERMRQMPASLAGLIGWVGLVLYLVMPNAPADDLLVAMTIRAATLACVSAMFVSAFAPGSSFRAFCSRPWISLVGGACYSIYLTHLQVIQATTSGFAKMGAHVPLGVVAIYLLVEIVAVFVVGMSFYVLIERPFMIKNWPDRLMARLRSYRPFGAHAFPDP